MKPVKSYRIWFSPRTGSTLLCKALESTGMAGKPGEFFNIDDQETLYQKHQAKDFQELQKNIWAIGSSENGIFGIKHSLFSSLSSRIYQEIAQLKQINTLDEYNPDQVLDDLFPNCKHIYLTRRNKVRQAVSWWKAIKDNVWHLEKTQSQQSEMVFYEQNYVFDALMHLFKEANLRDCATQDFFTRNQITPLSIIYEDFILDYEPTILKILDYLNLDTQGISIGAMHYQKTATQNSEIWVQRFREDLQKSWDKIAW